MEKESRRKQRQTDAWRGISGKGFREKVYPFWRGVCSEGNMKCFVPFIRKLVECQTQAVSLQNGQVILRGGALIMSSASKLAGTGKDLSVCQQEGRHLHSPCLMPQPPELC